MSERKRGHWRERGLPGRCKLHAYKVAIRGKVALCETRGTSVPITARTKARGGGGGQGQEEVAGPPVQT